MDISLQKVILEHLDRVKVPVHYDKVYKDECMFSFNTPLSFGGLYLNLNSLQSFSQEYVDLDFQRNNFPLYLHETQTKVPIPEDEVKELEKKPEKLAIGVEGGFQVDKDKYRIEKAYELVILPSRQTIPLSNELPLKLQEAVEKIKAHVGAAVQQSTTAWEEPKPISKYAESLKQLPNDKKISMRPQDWDTSDPAAKYQDLPFPKTKRLCFWQNWNNTGGTGAALRHFEALGKMFPLAVKLGTITPSGADVYSYAEDEDCMVTDPYLEDHLRHWGIEMKQMKQTEKTMTEMQVELNMQFEFNRITEASSMLVPVTGPCYVGLKNLGNSCYMNAVLQVLWMVPSVRERYLEDTELIFMTSPSDPSDDFFTQMTKLGLALIYGKTGYEPHEGDNEWDLWSVRPLRFKTLVGRGHVDFSTALQQDSCHYFMHLIEIMDHAENTVEGRLPSKEARRSFSNRPLTSFALQDEALTSAMFAFQTEERFFCTESKRVRYKTAQTVVLQLDIPLEMAINKTDVDDYNDRQMKRQKLLESGADAEISVQSMENGSQKVVEINKDDAEEKVLPKVPFDACLSKFAANTIIEDYYSPQLKCHTAAIKTTRLKTFPPFLMVQLNRYFIDEMWQPKKMEVLVEPPDVLNLNALRAPEHDPHELLQPETDGDRQQNHADPNIVNELKSMGFSENACIKAAMAVSNQSIESATEWLCSHMNDQGIDDPISDGSSKKKTDPEKIDMLERMGFAAEASEAALIESKNNLDEAINWLLSNTEQLETLVPAILNRAEASTTPPKFLDGNGEYDLVGFISHMGSSTSCGHYVCHIKKNRRWILFNDEKVAASESPPCDLGYMYLYKRRDIEGVDE